MNSILPLFPLQLVAFPDERLALHIFEERYQQLIADCEKEGITFGIPTYIDGALRYGTEMTLVKVAKRYPGGASDIVCRGGRLFEIKDFTSKLPSKLYAGGSVVFLENNFESVYKSNLELLKLIDLFYKRLEVQSPPYDSDTFNSYTLAHKLGLSLDQEYELLKLYSEEKRIEFLKHHLEIMISTLSAVSRTKELIALNGHFKHFDPLDFNNLDI